MSKMPEGLTLIRMDTKIYQDFKEYCDEEGFVVSKHIGFKIRDFLRDKDWIPLEVRKSRDASSENQDALVSGVEE